MTLPAHLISLICAALPMMSLTACLHDDPVVQSSPIEWNQITTPAGALNVAVVRPTNEGSMNHPVIVALPWGAGTRELVEAFVQRYWLTEPASRGYYVVSPEVLGSSLETTADDIIPALFQWIESEFAVDASQVALVGASNGGRGLFFAATAQPDRFQVLLALPGQYRGDERNLAVLAGKPVRMIVGEFDTNWVEGTRLTAEALRSQGVDVEVDIAGTQGHVLDLVPSGLMDWIDRALGR